MLNLILTEICNQGRKCLGPFYVKSNDNICSSENAPNDCINVNPVEIAQLLAIKILWVT